MKLSKAKEILQEELNYTERSHEQDLQDAIHLAVEALNWLILSRITTPGSVPTLLHGETLD